MPHKRPTTAAPVRDLELHVLLAVFVVGDEAYPLAIRGAIVARTKRRVSRAAVFITLERLEDKGLVRSWYGDPTPVRGGRAKRFFRATPAGVTAARAALDLLASMSAGLDAQLKRS